MSINRTETISTVTNNKYLIVSLLNSIMLHIFVYLKIIILMFMHHYYYFRVTMPTISTSTTLPSPEMGYIVTSRTYVCVSCKCVTTGTIFDTHRMGFLNTVTLLITLCFDTSEKEKKISTKNTVQVELVVITKQQYKVITV